MEGPLEKLLAAATGKLVNGSRIIFRLGMIRQLKSDFHRKVVIWIMLKKALTPLLHFFQETVCHQIQNAGTRKEQQYPIPTITETGVI